MAGLGSLYIDLLARTGKFETDIGRAARVAERESKKIQKEFGDKLQKQFDDLGRKAKAAIVGYLGVQTLQSIVRISDQYTQLRGRLALVTEGTEQLGQVQQALFGIAQRTRTEMSGVADLYIKLAQTGRDLGASQEELLKFTEGVGNALTVSGSNAQQASGALLQLSQALAGGTVRAEEFNSMIEGAPEILRTVAANMDGMGGSIGKLRQAVVKGQVSSQEFFQAFLKGSDSLAERAQSMPVTVGQAIVRMQNNINQAIAGTDMSPLVNAINQLSNTISQPSIQKSLASIAGGILSVGSVALKVLAPIGRFIQLAGDIGALIDNKLFDRPLSEDEFSRIYRMNPRGSGPTRRRVFPGSENASRDMQPETPSEEFLKVSAKLEEQIALYGKVGKAAEISYAIQSGALDELNKSEQQQLLALAKRYDAVVRSADAQKKAAEEQKKAIDEVTKMTQSLEEQIATFGMGETAVLQYRIAHGDLAKAFEYAGEEGEGLKDRLINLTRELELMTEAADKAAEAMDEFAQQNRDNLESSLEAFEADFEARFMKGGEALTVFVEEAARGTQDIIADSLISGFDKGAKGVLQSFGQLMVKITAEIVAADLTARLFQGLASLGGGGAAGSFGALFGGARAIGGPVLAGMTYRVNEREPEFFRPRVGGDIIPLSKMPNMGGGMVVNQNFSVRSETGERVSRRTEQQVAAAASRGLAVAGRRNN